MSQNQEIIEAKLCAYIDDELDAAGRSDLERHLAANPQHQRLIEELRRTSALVRNLPHESAPPELAEGFGAQLERSVLLEGVSEDVAAADLKAPRWPQLVAMAAITLLTVGLAVVVYFALPGIGGRPQIVQTLPHSMTPMPGALDEDHLADAKMRDLDKTANADKEKFAATKDQSAVLESPSIAMAAPAAPVPAMALKGSPIAAGLAMNRPSEESRAKAAGAKSASANGSEPVVLVMHSEDPGDARRSLVIYLVQQNIAWEPAQVPAGGIALARRDAADGVNAVGGALQPQQAAVAAGPVAKQLRSDGARERQVAKSAVPTTSLSGESGGFAAGLPADQPALAPEPSPTAPPVLNEAKRSENFQGTVASNDRAGGEEAAAKPDFAISCRVTLEQAQALRESLAGSGTSIDALPAELEKNLADVKKDKSTAFFELGTTAVPFVPAPVAAATAPAATNPSADGTPAPTRAPGAVGADELRKLSADAPQPAEAGKLPADATTQPANEKVAMVDLVIVVRPSDHPSTQPTAPAVAGAPTTEPTEPSAPAQPIVPVAPTTQPQ